MASNKEFKVGMMVIASLAMAYIGVNYLKGQTIFSNNNIYYVFYKDAYELSTSNEVVINGYKVGRVQNLEILPEDDYRIKVSLEIDKSLHITNKTVAKLVSKGLLGKKYIELIMHEGGEAIGNHATILSDIERDLQTVIAENTLPWLNNAASITTLTNQFMQNLVDNSSKINSIFSNLEKTTQQLQHALKINNGDIKRISNNIVEFTNVLTDKKIGLEPLLTQLNKLADELDVNSLNKLTGSLHETTNKINQWLTFMNAEQLYNNINKTLIDLDKLLIDLRMRPNRYVHFSFFGGNPVLKKHIIQKQEADSLQKTDLVIPPTGTNPTNP